MSTGNTDGRYGWPGTPPEWQPPGRPGRGPSDPTGPRVPGRPSWSAPPDAPGSGSDSEPAPWLEQRMFEQQMVSLSGPITNELASRLGAQLMTLEALATPRTGPIRLHITSPDGDLGAAFALIDVLDLMRSPVRAVALGAVGGAALGVYAAAPERLAYPHARFRLVEPRVDEMAGTADEVARAAGSHLRLLDDLVVLLAGTTGRPRAEIERDLSERRELSAAEAIEYGLVQRLTDPSSRGPAAT
ncbi:MAG: ATP-dependent Clp protease proteolytic subunit [Actinocatenispora sp.]